MVIMFGPCTLRVAVSTIPLPESPLLGKWEPVKMRAKPRALGIMYKITDISPGMLAVISMLVWVDRVLQQSLSNYICSPGTICAIG